MEGVDWIRDAAFTPLCGERATLAADRVYLLADPEKYAVETAAGARTQLLIVHTRPASVTLSVSVAEDAELAVAEIFLAEAFADFSIRQHGQSRCRMTTVELTSANVKYGIDLDGAGARSELDGLFLAGGKEHCEVAVRVNHNVPDCSSRSLVKGVAGGDAKGAFRGLVYVAPDAQRTDAQQTSRNIELTPTARIVTKPQLEIYADDVKCSHGATVGQLDDDAILYMRQRGLSEVQARRLQLEGFVGAIAAQCGVEAVRDRLYELIVEKLERM